MRIEHETPYPTVGEVVQTVFRWTGLWHFLSKEDDCHAEGSRNSKTVQKDLQRFAAEETLLCPGSIIRMVSESLSNVLKCEVLCKFAERSMHLFLLSYVKEVRDNATWLDRGGNARWFIHTRACLALVLPAQRMSMLGRHKEVRGAIRLPDDTWWFLPGQDGNGVWKTPIQKVIAWWMRDNGFATPEALECAIRKKGQVSAVTIRSWISGKAIPEISTLQVIMESSLGLGAEEEVKKRSLLALLILARLTSNFFVIVQRLLGEDEAKDLISDLKALYMAFEKSERKTFNRMLPSMLVRLGTDEENATAEDLLFCESFFGENELMPRLLASMNEVVRKQAVDFLMSDDFVSEHARIWWRRNNPVEVVSVVLKLVDIQRIVNSTRLMGCLVIPENTIQQLGEAYLALPSGVNAHYMMTTVKARQAVCDGDCEKAFQLYIDAFHEARYRGGVLMKQICEELIALCCFRHAMACEHRLPRGDYWKVAKYLREWSKLTLMCPEFIVDDDDVYVEKGRSFFMRLMGAPEVG